MSQLSKELKNTFNQLSSAFRNDESKESKRKTSTNQRVATKEPKKQEVEEYINKLNKAENEFDAGRIVSSFSQKNKPRRAIVINESKTVKAMKMTEKDDAFYVIDEIREEQAVIVLFDDVDGNTQKAILDRIYGACRYGKIRIEKLGPRMILIDPKLVANF